MPHDKVADRRNTASFAPMDDATSRVISILRADSLRWHLLGIVAALDLPDCWIAAGFVRSAVRDNLHGRPASRPAGDVDVIWFDPRRRDPAEDRLLEATLQEIEPAIGWSVKNQARMHLRNGDRPYASAHDAMRFWPETATAVAARRIGADQCDLAAPLGLDDLFGLILRPGPSFAEAKRAILDKRLRSKRWLQLWPGLREARAVRT